MKKKLLSIILLLALCLSVFSLDQIKAATGTYKVVAYQQKITTVIGYAPYELFYFYKNGKRINAPEKAHYISSDSSIVEVEDSYGTAFFRGKKVGTATVTCTYQGSSASIEIEVRKMAANVNGWKFISIPEGESAPITIENQNNKNIGDITIKSSNPSVATVSTPIAKPFIWSDDDPTASYSGGQIEAKKAGVTYITLRSKVGAQKLKVTVIPKFKLNVSNQKVTKQEDGYKFTYTITNKGNQTITVGGPAEVLVFRGLYSANMKQKEKKLAKGKSATYTFFVPLNDATEFIDETIFQFYFAYKGYSYRAYIEENGNVTASCSLGRIPLSAVLSDTSLN